MTPNVVMARDTEAWLHDNFAAISDALFVAAYRAWLSRKVADRKDNDNAICQMMHKATVMEFHEILTQ